MKRKKHRFVPPIPIFAGTCCRRPSPCRLCRVRRRGVRGIGCRVVAIRFAALGVRLAKAYLNPIARAVRSGFAHSTTTRDSNVPMRKHASTMSLTVSKRVDLVRSRNKPQRPPTGKRRHGGGKDRATTVWKKMLMDVCDQCSLHGLNHIVNEDRSTGERSVSAPVHRITEFGAHVAVRRPYHTVKVVCTVQC